MEKIREWKDYEPEEKLLAIKSYLEGMIKLDDSDTDANRVRLEWIREHLPAYNPENGKNFIFVSYSHLDYEKVYSDLAYFSYNPNTIVRYWYDEGLPVGTDWEKAAGKVMENPHCVGVIFYLSKNLLLSPSVYKEIEAVDRLQKPYFAVALNAKQYSAEKIFDEASGKELRAIKDNQEKLEKFFPPAHTALIMGEDNVQARIAKIANQFNVTEDALSDFVCREVSGGLCLIEYKGIKTEVYIPEYKDDKPIVEVACEFGHVVKLHVPRTVKNIDVEKLNSAYNLEYIEVDSGNSDYFDLNGVLCLRKPYNSILRVPINWDWKNQFEDDGSMWEADFISKKLSFSGLRHLMVSKCGQPLAVPGSEENVLAHLFCGETYEIEQKEFKGIYLKLLAALGRDTVGSVLKGDVPGSVNNFSSIYSSTENRYDIYLKTKQISIFKGIISIRQNAFEKCRKIDYLFLPDDIVNIANGAFKESNIKFIVLPDKIKKISDEVFCECRNLRIVITKNDFFEKKGSFNLIGNIILCGNIKSIGKSAFQNTLINNVMIGNCVEIIGDSAFKNCEHLLKITFSKSVKYIGDSAFENCFLLNELTLPDGLKTISQSSFQNCFYLKNLTISSSVGSIAYHAFLGCGSIKEVVFNRKKSEWYNFWDASLYDFQLQANMILPMINYDEKTIRMYGLINEPAKREFYCSPENVPYNLRKAKIICTDGIIEPSINQE